MIRKKLLILAVVALAGCSTSKKVKNMDTKSTKTDFISLFDGKTTTGWHTYGKSTIVSDWKIEDGTLHLSPESSGGGDLVTDQEYDNFHLKLEWKISPNGNSGIIFYVHEDTLKYKNTYNTGPEMQVLDNNGHPDAKIHKHRAGDLYDLVASKSEPVKPANEWNQVEIISNKGKLDFFLNGVNIVSTNLWDADWQKLLEGSKFKTMPGFGTYKSGKIALQNHGDEVWYRNIKIQKL